ncbi:unnamed protein product [Sphacelaria rigidula]
MVTMFTFVDMALQNIFNYSLCLRQRDTELDKGTQNTEYLHNIERKIVCWTKGHNKSFSDDTQFLGTQDRPVAPVDPPVPPQCASNITACSPLRQYCCATTPFTISISRS